MTPEEVAALSDEELIEEILNRADYQEAIAGEVLRTLNHPTLSRKYHLQLEAENGIVAALCAEALRRMSEGREAGR